MSILRTRDPGAQRWIRAASRPWLMIPGTIAPGSPSFFAASTVSYYAVTLQDNGIDPGDMVAVTFAIIIGAGAVYGFGSPWMAGRLGVRRGLGLLVSLAPLDDAQQLFFRGQFFF